MTDSTAIYVSARAAGGSWRTLGLVPLILDDGMSTGGRLRYGDTRLDVPLPGHTAGAPVDLRIWQHVDDGEDLRVSARTAGGSWRTLGTVPLVFDGLSGDGRLRFSDVTLEAPLPAAEVTTLAEGFGRSNGVSSPTGWYGFGIEVARDGTVIVADRENSVVRRVAPDGAVTTIAGSWQWPGLQDGLAETARFDDPRDVAVAPDGTIYVADAGNGRVRKIAPDGTVSTVAGSDREGAEWHEIRDGPAEQALFQGDGPVGLALDWYGDLYILERYAVRRLSPSGWISTALVGDGSGWRDGPADEAQVTGLHDIAVDDAGNLYVIDDSRGLVSADGPVLAIRKIGVDGIVETLYRDAAPSLGGTLAYPAGIAVSGSGSVYLSNTGRDQIVMLTEEGELRAVAGTGEEGHLDGPRRAARFSAPGRMAFAPDGALVVADQSGTVIRRVAVDERRAGSEGIPLVRASEVPRVPGVRVSVFAGSGEQGFRDGPAEDAQFLFPWAMTLDESGHIIVADRGNHAIRSVAPDGTVTTLAGGNGAGTRDGPCHDARFTKPSGVVADTERRVLYVSSGHRIRRIDREGASCVVTTVAGAEQGFADGPAAAARFAWPGGLALDDDGGLLIADEGYSLIRRLSPEGYVETIARGTSSARLWSIPGSRDGPVDLARFSLLSGGLAIDDEGNIFFPESNNAIRKIDSAGFVSTVLRTDDYGRGGALSAFTHGIAIGPDGELFVSDHGFGRVVRVSPGGLLAIVADREDDAVLRRGQRGLDPGGLLLTPAEDLFVTSRHGSVILRITFGETAAKSSPALPAK